VSIQRPTELTMAPWHLAVGIFKVPVCSGHLLEQMLHVQTP
jgi:hypothetical protein